MNQETREGSIDPSELILATADGREALRAVNLQTGELEAEKLSGFPGLDEKEARLVLVNWAEAFHLATQVASEVSSKMRQGKVDVSDQATLALDLRNRMNVSLIGTPYDQGKKSWLQEAANTLNAICQNNPSEISEEGLEVAKLVFDYL